MPVAKSVHIDIPGGYEDRNYACPERAAVHPYHEWKTSTSRDEADYRYARCYHCGERIFPDVETRQGYTSTLTLHESP